MVKYKRLVAELAAKKVAKKSVCDLLGICEKTFWNKVHGESDFSLREAFAIRDTFFPHMRIEELFSSD